MTKYFLAALVGGLVLAQDVTPTTALRIQDDSQRPGPPKCIPKRPPGQGPIPSIRQN